MIKGIYNAIQQSGVTAHKYYDETYAKVSECRDIAEGAALAYRDDVRVLFDNIVDEGTCKHYWMSIEDEHTGEILGGGVITACFCGTMQHPRSAYDVCASWWNN